MRPLTLCTALLAGLVLPALASPALAGPGDPYGTRDPVTCASRGGADEPPTPEQAARYVACEIESASGSLEYLTADMAVQVASTPRPLDPSDSADDPDPARPVYAIRGSYKRYACSLLDSYDAEQHPGRQCSYTDQPRAEGLCYVTTFGEWHCTMRDVMHTGFDVEHVPPPM